MKKAVSTNWCSRKISDGREISDKAAELGFDELELGYSLRFEQVEGIRDRLDLIPVGSVHAFCPVPMSAPHAHPELYSLASFSEPARALAKTCIVKNIEFAASVGAKTLVLHAGSVGLSRMFRKMSSAGLRDALRALGDDPANAKYVKAVDKARKLRLKRGEKMLALFIRELETLIKVLETNSVGIAFENLPYLEGFPDEAELKKIVSHFSSPFVSGWFDTGHDAVRRNMLYADGAFTPDPALYAGVHVNDVISFDDDHFAPGFGKIDFSRYADIFANAKHIVFEPDQNTTEENLKKGIENYERQLQSRL